MSVKHLDTSWKPSHFFFVAAVTVQCYHSNGGVIIVLFYFTILPHYLPNFSNLFSSFSMFLFLYITVEVQNDNSKAAVNKEIALVVEDVLRIELRVGLIISAERHPDAETLYIEKIDCGEPTGPRSVISGLAKFIPLGELVGRKVIVVCNLKPSKMRGIVSEGMVLAASAGSDESEIVELLEAPEGAVVGELINIEGLPVSTPDTQLKSKSALDAWKRVGALLATNNELSGTYTSPSVSTGGEGVQRRLLTSGGPCVVRTLKGAAIR